jgi:seryl-tRNA synthetase
MLDLKFIRENADLVRAAMAKRREDVPIDEVLRLDEERRRLLHEVEELKHRRNATSQDIPKIKDPAEKQRLIVEMREIGDTIKRLDAEVALVSDKLNELLLIIPNIPHHSVPPGKDDSDNVVLNYWGEPRQFAFAPLAHWDIGERLGIIDFERGVKVSGARFYVLRGSGAKLERALVNFMLDLHVSKHGYVEIYPPFLVKRESMLGTGQLPKFAEDSYYVESDDLFLDPTAEVPVTNLYRDEILEPGTLPIYHAAFTTCFRREAGAAGRDTRGLIRVHQFDKVELVKFVVPETSYEELDRLVDDAEDVLKLLEMPYRLVLMSTGDLGFTAAKKYDLEVWMSGQDRYVEISSCSNFEAFQARRANIRYRPVAGEKPEFVHTINGSGLAVGRTMAALLENCQQADGTVLVPEALRPYMGGQTVIG